MVYRVVSAHSMKEIYTLLGTDQNLPDFGTLIYELLKMRRKWVEKVAIWEIISYRLLKTIFKFFIRIDYDWYFEWSKYE